MTTLHACSFAERRRYSAAARAVLVQLEHRLETVLREVQRSEVWHTVTSPETPFMTLRATIREIMFSVQQYQPHTTEAGFAMLGRLPKSETKLLISLLTHKAEEAAHGGWARRDFVRLDGSAERLGRASTPAAFAVSAVWDRMATHESPFGYLGAEYLFERLTMEVAPAAMTALNRHGVPADQIGFISEHTEEDVKHTNLIAHWILESATRYAEAGDAMVRCFDYFASVYPLPVWNEALARAVAAASD